MNAKFFTLLISLFTFGTVVLSGQSDLVSYAGNSGKEVFYDVMQLSDGSVLVVGGADNLDWISADVPKIELSYSATIPNAMGTNRYGFILRLNEDLSEMLQVVHFPQGAVEDIRFVKTTSIPYEATGSLYISCNTLDSDQNNGGYVIAKLSNNFVEGIPGSLDWVNVVWAKSGPKDYHPWDVTNDGRVYYVSGEAHGYDWSAMYCLSSDGVRMPVEHWRTHWLTNGTEWKGTPASANPDGGIEAVNYSGIVFKIWGRCELRSWTEEDFNATLNDGNGGTKKGRWPVDILFSGPCDPENPTADGPGYTGYSAAACCPVFGASSVTIDRRDNHVYLGMNMKSYSVPFDSPDFEPAVIAMDDQGALLWWSRLYHEITPAGDTMPSIPDQYVDALSIDYFSNSLVVGARCHGNNTENFWEGNTIASDPDAYGFQNRFTGTFGNIHLSWLGKLMLEDGTLMNSTYMAELFEGTSSLGTEHPDPNLAGWPDPNTGWPDVNTTRLAVNNMKVSSTGDVCVLGVGRRTLTTSNAYQHNISPFDAGSGCWNSFARVYDPQFHVPKYSSLIVGQWDTGTQQGGGNTDMFGIWKTGSGVIAVGRQSALDGVANGNDIPVINVPAWGSSSAENESAILVYYKADNLINPTDDPLNTIIEEKNSGSAIHIYPNPASHMLNISISGNNWITPNTNYLICDSRGSVVKSGKYSANQIEVSELKSGVYSLKLFNQFQVQNVVFEILR